MSIQDAVKRFNHSTQRVGLEVNVAAGYGRGSVPQERVVSGITIDTHSLEFYPVCQSADSCSLAC